MATQGTQPSHVLPPPFSTSDQPSDSMELITQGAEALLYKTSFLSPDTPAALKIRPKKSWRHPVLDKRLTRQRILAEARVLVKCKGSGVAVPGVLGVDWEGKQDASAGATGGWMAMEWILGVSVKEGIWGWEKRRSGKEGEEGNPGGGGGAEDLRLLLEKIGRAVGKLHSIGLIHGDLTTSNMMIRPSGPLSTTTDISAKTTTIPPASSASISDRTTTTSSDRTINSLDGDIVLIDFGLATQATQEEDRAVDLYVLERAFGSTHPREEGLFGVVLEAYSGSYKGAQATLKRLEDVRMRGRKKSMIG